MKHISKCRYSSSWTSVEATRHLPQCKRDIGASACGSLNGLEESWHQSPSDPEESGQKERGPEESGPEDNGPEDSGPEESDPEESLKGRIPSPRVSEFQVQVPGGQILFEGDGLEFSE